MNYRFADPNAFMYLWLALATVLIGLFFMRQRLRGLARHFGPKIFPVLSASLSMGRRRNKILLVGLAAALMVFALARPQSGQSQQKVTSQGIELVMLVDISRSMLAEDIKPSRLELAKRELSRLLDMGGGDRVGLVAFAGSAVMLSPMTTDKPAVKMYLDSLSPEAVSSQGTDFRQALLEAERAFKQGGSEDDAETVVTRAVLIASDGEDNEQGALDAAKMLTDRGIRIFTLAFGTEKGGPIPVRGQRGELRGYRKDKAGKVILSQVKDGLLRELASVGQGRFHHVTFGSRAMAEMKADLDQLEKAEFESAEFTNYDERYQIFLFFGLLLALLDIFLGERRPVGRVWRGRFEVVDS